MLEFPSAFDLLHIILLILCVVLTYLLFRGEIKTASPETNKETPKPSAPPQEKQGDVEHQQVQPEKSALILLAAFQREARLIDFVHEDIHAFSDEQVGAAVRLVHKGLKQVLDNHFTLSSVRTEDEGDAIILAADFDKRSVTLMGDVVGDPPYKGVLVHPGWQVISVKLPKTNPNQDIKLLAPAEVQM